MENVGVDLHVGSGLCPDGHVSLQNAARARRFEDVAGFR
jgi:hypothetical protein